MEKTKIVNIYADTIDDENADWELELRKEIVRTSPEYQMAQAVKKAKKVQDATIAQQNAAQEQPQTAVVPTIVNRIERMSGQEWTNVLLIIVIILLVLILIFK